MTLPNDILRLIAMTADRPTQVSLREVSKFFEWIPRPSFVVKVWISADVIISINGFIILTSHEDMFQSVNIIIGPLQYGIYCYGEFGGLRVLTMNGKKPFTTCKTQTLVDKIPRSLILWILETGRGGKKFASIAV